MFHSLSSQLSLSVQTSWLFPALHLCKLCKTLYICQFVHGQAHLQAKFLEMELLKQRVCVFVISIYTVKKCESVLCHPSLKLYASTEVL